MHYTYWDSGQVSNITLKDEWLGEGDPPDEYTWYYDLALFYTSAGKVYGGLWGRWQLNGYGQPYNYERQAQRRFAYDGYNLVRMRDVPADSDDGVPDYPETESWRDCLGGQVYGDFQVSVGAGPGYNVTVTGQKRYLSGPGLANQNADGTNTRYRHADLIDSTMLQTNASGGLGSDWTITYTAFGEPVVWTGSAWRIGGPLPEGYPRYGYAGGHGYESELLTLDGAPGTPPIALLHVGWRWYEPQTGRFIQRDPMALAGGLNVYAYCANEPVASSDPTGLMPPGAQDFFCPVCHRFVNHCVCKYVPPSPKPPGSPAKPPWVPGQAKTLDEAQMELGEMSTVVCAASWIGGPWTGVPTCVIVALWNLIFHVERAEAGLYD